MSGPYLHGHHASVLRSHSWRTAENSCPHLLPYLSNPSLKLLDVGCGPGTITVDLASRVPEGFVIGIDPSADVIQKARKHAEEKGVTNVRFEVGDIFNWKEIDGIQLGAFDVVHAHQVLQHLRDPLGAMAELKKLTKKDGIVAVRDCDYSAMNWYPEHPGMHTTDTIDYAIVLEGEIVAIMDEGERVMKQGDILVQRGTSHAWANRSGKPVKVAFILISARR